jgi:hypothetical protein
MSLDTSTALHGRFIFSRTTTKKCAGVSFMKWRTPLQMIAMARDFWPKFKGSLDPVRL